MSGNTEWQIKDESVSSERLDGETILINFDTGQYFSFQGASADVLWLVQAGIPRQEWPSLLQAAFNGLEWNTDRDNEVDAFLLGLAEVGVIEPAASADAGPEILPTDYERGAWSAPSIFANDDLADLLIIDPIHDSSEDGWPQARSS